MTRAKFRCNAEITRKYGVTAEQQQRVYEFAAIYDESIPEDQRFAKATPSGKLEIAIDNPDVVFEPGKSYYLDITPVEA